VTRDFSRSGMLLTFPADARLPDVGERVSVVIELPHSPSMAPRYLECGAKTVRVIDTEAEPPSAAFTIRRARMQRSSA
jgi:hypothetical protein